jgi:hypothetical protein
MENRKAKKVWLEKQLRQGAGNTAETCREGVIGAQIFRWGMVNTGTPLQVTT